MSLIETTKVDQIEILENNIIQVRTATLIEKDGIELTRTFHRHTLNPGDNLESEDPKVVAIANTVWTEEVIAEYQSRPVGIL